MKVLSSCALIIQRGDEIYERSVLKSPTFRTERKGEPMVDGLMQSSTRAMVMVLHSVKYRRYQVYSTHHDTHGSVH